MKFFAFFQCSLVVLLATIVNCTWFKHALKDVDCNYANQWRCEDSLQWQALCPICKKCYNICVECRDFNMACKKHTIFPHPDCKDENSEIYQTCKKSCGACKCNRSIEDLPEECLEHFKKVMALEEQEKEKERKEKESQQRYEL